MEDDRDLVASELRMAANFPRYARVNLLKTTPNEARKELEADGLLANVDAHIGYILKLA